MPPDRPVREGAVFASGSSTTSTSSIEPGGSARQTIVGGVPAPSQVFAAGIAAPSLKFGVENVIVSGAAGRSLFLLVVTAAAAREGHGDQRRRYERAAGAHCCSARSPVPSRAAGVGTAGLSRRYHSASSAA